MREILCPISQETLMHLYQDLKQTDEQIALAIGNSATAKRVRSWRRRFGIETIPRWSRNNISPIEGRLKSLLIGSLLGDGRVVCQKNASYYVESHSDAQKEYLEWKMRMWGAWGKSLKEVVWTLKGKEFLGWIFRTCSHESLNEFRMLFYDRLLGRGSKRLNRSLIDMVDSYALTIWYLDDGSLGWWPGITFGMDVESRDIARQIFSKFGLTPKWILRKGNTGIFEFRGEEQASRFLDLIRPHVPSCMMYKIESPGFMGQHFQVRKKIDIGQLKEFASAGKPIRQIADYFGVGQSTISRYMSKNQVVHPRRIGRPPSSPTAPIDAITRLEQFTPKEGYLASDAVVDEIYGILSKMDFPYSPVLDSDATREQYQKVVEAKTWLDGDGQIMPNRRVGLKLCQPFFPNRYSAVSLSRKSALDAWHTEKELKKAIRFQLKVGDPVLPHRVLRAITMNCRTPAIFRPTVAKFMYERYCPKGGLTYDPCAGYGGRLLGAVAAGVRYIGTDVDEDTIRGNQELAQKLGADVTLIQSRAEEYQPPTCDLVFTSPPYFQQEQYSTNADQSWQRYSDIDAWLDGFLRPVIRAARVAPVLALNIAKVGDLDLPDHTTRVAQEEGWHLSERLLMPLAKLNRQIATEPILVFRQNS